MNETDRLRETLDEFFTSEHKDNITALVETFECTVIDCYRRYQELALEDEDMATAIQTLAEEMKEATTTYPTDKVILKELMADFAMRAVELRRATYDLTNPESVWADPLTPAEAVALDDDTYTYVIVDAMIDRINQIGEEPEPELGLMWNDSEAGAGCGSGCGPECGDETSTETVDAAVG